ncbi:MULTISPECIES: flagellar filament capping protein FliD [Alkalimonas]|uniref:Flagellar hook-associated protein 2 n=1 Tax=Alkalimonas mucilaginosa TaxID=3057676 RepID=A0ABU7JEC2_9GAMM|nr:flagellar filament capping protein FliD [Alkalimonas sp. MEB004]MEE2024042.1 flagellar filament capping protein FliD [Alkalimonas sp. MEB004]
MSSFLTIDPQYLASQYTQIERAGKDKVLANKANQFTGQLNAIRKLQTALKDFSTQLKDFRSGDNSMLANTATSSSESTLSVKAGAKAVAGSYEIFVEQLAQNHQLAMSFDPNATLATDGEFSIDLAGSSFSVDLASLPAGATLTDLTAAINNHVDNPGVKATLMRSGTETFLVISSEESGEANQLTLDFTPGADAAGADITAALAARQELTKAQDAKVRFGSDAAISVTSASNTLTDVIEGVSIDLLRAQAGTDGPVRVTIGQDEQAIKDNLQQFISSYNSVVSGISKDDSLKRDSMARSIQNQFRAALQGTFEGSSLYSIGIEFDRNGVLSINASRFEQALAADPAKLEAMLTGEDGMLAKLENTIEPYSKNFGLLTDKQKTLQASLDLITDQKKRHDYSMELAFRRYLGQFTQMQVTIAQLESSLGQF